MGSIIAKTLKQGLMGLIKVIHNDLAILRHSVPRSRRFSLVHFPIVFFVSLAYDPLYRV